MKKSRFTEEQVVRMLQEVDRTSAAAVAKAHGVSEQTLYNWRKQYDGMAVENAWRSTWPVRFASIASSRSWRN
jgi:putative transposase